MIKSKPTFKAWIKAILYRIGNFFIRYPLATAATVLLVIGAVVLSAFGQKFQIGGVLGKLWGRKHPGDLPDSPVITPSQSRTDESGTIIQPGVSDDKGFVQAPVVLPIKTPTVFSDPTVVTVTHPDGSDVKIPLPKGVKNKDVKEVVLVSPNVYQVANRDKGTDAGKLLEDLLK